MRLNHLELLKQLNINTNNPSLYEQALTHSSYANEHDMLSNERLEFLGDAVLQLLMSKYLFSNYPDEDEGILTKLRAKYVCEESLFIYSKTINLKEYIKLGNGDLLVKGPTVSMVADAMEALLAAIYLDQGYDKVIDFFNNVFVHNINKTELVIDYKTELQELMIAEKRMIKYKIIQEMGPAHNKTFKAAVYLNDIILIGTGIGKTKKEAEQNAAKDVLNKGEYGSVKGIIWKV